MKQKEQFICARIIPHGIICKTRAKRCKRIFRIFIAGAHLQQTGKESNPPAYDLINFLEL